MVQTFHIKQSQPSNTSSANNAQLAKTILQTTALICKAGQISTMNSMQNWSDSYCKTVISILNLARTILQTSDQNWSDSICKPMISILNLARTSLQTSGHVFKPVIFKFILHPPYHHITSQCSFWISTKQCTIHSSPVIPHSAALISKQFFFFRSFEFSFKPSFQINPASPPTPPGSVLPQNSFVKFCTSTSAAILQSL